VAGRLARRWLQHWRTRGARADPYSVWPQVLLEAAQAVDRPVYVGHSTGGEDLLSTPGLAGCLAGLVLISTAPDASWLPVYEEMVTKNPLPGDERISLVANHIADTDREWRCRPHRHSIAVAGQPLPHRKHHLRVIVDAGHFPWIGQPVAVRDAFAEVTQRIPTHRRSG
jgi:pimeloyl-ACP methyl ester carboxylesterase